jgi:hypothetical protein
MKLKFYPPFIDSGEVVAAWGQAQLIRYLDGETELRGGSKEDRLAAQEWISLFWHGAGPEGSGGLRTIHWLTKLFQSLERAVDPTDHRVLIHCAEPGVGRVWVLQWLGLLLLEQVDVVGSEWSLASLIRLMELQVI